MSNWNRGFRFGRGLKQETGEETKVRSKRAFNVEAMINSLEADGHLDMERLTPPVDDRYAGEEAAWETANGISAIGKVYVDERKLLTNVADCDILEHRGGSSLESSLDHLGETDDEFYDWCEGVCK